MSSLAISTGRSRIPLALKLVFTAFFLVWVPFYYMTYGPTNFLYFCDMSLFFTLAALWSENALLASIPAVGLLLPQTLWVIDFCFGLFGGRLTGMTAYMFDKGIPPFSRALSTFHGWLPFLLLYMVYRLGYDRRALVIWTVLAWGLMLIAYFFLPVPPAPADNPNLPVNVNYVYGISDEKAQEWMAPWQWLAVMMVGLPLLFFLPAHFILSWMPKWQPEERKDEG